MAYGAHESDFEVPFSINVVTDDDSEFRTVLSELQSLA